MDAHSEKLPALLFCHPSMENLAEAIASRCSNYQPPTLPVTSTKPQQATASVTKDLRGPHILLNSMSHNRLTYHQPVQFMKTVNWGKFKDGWPDLFIQNVKEIAGRDVIFLGNFQSPDIIFEQLSVIYSIPRYLARSFKFILPYFSTGTMERIDTEGKIATAKTLARLLSAIPTTARGPSQIVIYDIHELQERFYFSDQVIPRLESALPLLVREMLSLPEDVKLKLTVAFPDEGAFKRFNKFFRGFPTITCTKIRDGDRRVINVKEGNPKDKHVIIVDDLVQTGGTLKECCKALLSGGAESVSGYVTHAVFPVESWKSFTTAGRKADEPEFRHFWITDSIPHANKICEHPPFKLISLCDVISEALLGYDLLQ